MKSRTTHAYTLIEVLTVITITGVLAALLLPSLRNMREQARKAQCLGNLHQLYLAYFNRKADEGFGVVRRLQNFPSHAMLLAGVLSQPKVFLCPSDHSPHWAGCGAIIETYDGNNAGVNGGLGNFLYDMPLKMGCTPRSSCSPGRDRYSALKINARWGAASTLVTKNAAARITDLGNGLAYCEAKHGGVNGAAGRTGILWSPPTARISALICRNSFVGFNVPGPIRLAMA